MKRSGNMLYRLIWIAAVPVIAGVIGLLLLAAAFMLPDEKIEEHVSASAAMLFEETDYRAVVPGTYRDKLDNYTEAIYLNEALVSVKDANIWECILSGCSYDSILPEAVSQTSNLYYVCAEPDKAELSANYDHFFNGYEIAVKPLLLITDYAGIRKLNIFLVVSLYLILCFLMYKRGLQKYILPVTVSMLFISPLSVAMCMTFCGFYCCMIIPCIILLTLDRKKARKWGLIIFEVTGACAFIFNMNYFQLLSFVMPMLFYFMVTGFPKRTFSLIKTGTYFFTLWFIGYAGVMVFKWAVYAVMIDHSMFTQMIEHIRWRTSTDVGSRTKAIGMNVRTALSDIYWDLIESVFICYGIYRICRRRREKNRIGLTAADYCLMAVMTAGPVFRYLIFSDHVIIHHWVTYRIIMATVMTFNILLVKAFTEGGGGAGNTDAVKGYILDVDGTLYDQSRVRAAMFGRLAAYYGVRPGRLKELYALYYFRKLREKPEYKEKTVEELYETVSEKARLPLPETSEVIQKWMFKVPLDLLAKYRFRDMIDFINRQHDEDKTVIIYSDYPAEEKLQALGIGCDKLYVSGMNGITGQKPSLSAMEKILSESGQEKERLMYIGDRDDRDRVSAETAGVKYMDVYDFLYCL